MRMLIVFFLLFTLMIFFFFFFNDPATTEIYTLSLHDALPISRAPSAAHRSGCPTTGWSGCTGSRDRKSTRLNSSHVSISYAVFCLKKKKKTKNDTILKQSKDTKQTHHQHQYYANM